jgi:Domain of unknown function (DUF5671)
VLLGALLPLLAIGAAGYGIYRLVASHGQPGRADAEGDLREQVGRAFRLGLLFTSLVLVAEGLAGLLAEALPSTGELAGNSTALARALSFTIVGVPALLGLARWTRRRLTDDPGEVRSVVWAAYLGGTLTVALVVTMVNANRTFQWVTGLASFDGQALGRTLVWGALLAAHWQLNQRRPLLDQFGAVLPRTPWYLLVGSLVGLATGATGMWQLVRASVRPLYDRAFAEVLVASGSHALGQAAIGAVIGSVVWGWFWLRHTWRGPRTERWYGFVLLGGVLGGLVATLVAAGVATHAVLQWLFGQPAAATASVHFDSMPGTVSVLLVGSGVWIHHRRTLAVAGVHRNEADRIYTYLVAVVGLVVCAAAVTLVVAAFVDAVVGAGAIRTSVANPIVLAVSFLAVGLPVWLVFWRRAQRNARADQGELRSPSRRLYLLVALGVSSAVALVALVVLLTDVLEDVTAGGLTAETLRRIRVPLGLVVAAATVAGYHLLVSRHDRQASPAPPPPSRAVREVVLVSDLSTDDADQVAQRLGGRVVRLTTAAVPAGSLPGGDALAQAVCETSALTTSRALVTVRRGRIEVEGLRS